MAQQITRNERIDGLEQIYSRTLHKESTNQYIEESGYGNELEEIGDIYKDGLNGNYIEDDEKLIYY